MNATQGKSTLIKGLFASLHANSPAVERNEALIMLPTSAKMLDLFVCARRGLYQSFWRQAVRHFRAMKKSQGTQAG